MLTYADVCSRQIQPDAALGVAMLTSAGVCWRMLTYADSATRAKTPHKRTHTRFTQAYPETLAQIVVLNVC